jgi:hypothetical protein
MAQANNVSLQTRKNYIKKAITDAITANKKIGEKNKVLYDFYIMWKHRNESALF